MALTFTSATMLTISLLLAAAKCVMTRMEGPSLP
jgi:hypothetical protein